MTAFVLIVDDSLTVRMDLIEAFDAAGMPAMGCDTLAAARIALARERVALVVLDLILPDGNGVDFVAEIRALPDAPAIPVLLLSSEAEVRDRITGLSTGADDYVGKPYDRDYVVERARELRREHAGQDATQRTSIMVIDDSITFREELSRALERRGYDVLVAGTGEEGLRLAAVHRPAAIVVDGVLPGIDGATVVRKLRLDAALRQTPCVLLTGSSADRSAELEALDAGADAFVRKEEDMDVILARLMAALRAGTSADDRNTASLLSPKRILAVDDSATYLDALGTMLRGEGYDVIPAHSGEDALEMLGVQSVDCILLDRLMPGMDGSETCRRIKGSPATRDIPLIMLTASEERSDMIEGLGSGADDYVLKSSENVVLKARLRAQLRRKQIEDEARRIRVQLLRKELEATEARAAKELAETKAALAEELESRNRELEALNKELETFSYTVSHDLRAPLRSVDGFSHLLAEQYGNALDQDGKDYLHRIRVAVRRMGQLIDDLLALSHVVRHDFLCIESDLSAIARRVAERIRSREPQRAVEWVVQDGLSAVCDPRLLEIALENLLGNAWKFTGKSAAARIEFGQTHDRRAYFVRDNGAGFDMAHASQLFGVFERLHTEAEFEGTGIGLATVKRIVTRHAGQVWAESSAGEGATFYFTLDARDSIRGE